jgi:hypothetical protein
VTSRFARAQRIAQAWFVRSHLMSLALLLAVLVCACSNEKRTGIQVYIAEVPEGVVEVRIQVGAAMNRVELRHDEPMEFFLEPSASLDAAVDLTLQGFDGAEAGAMALTGKQTFKLKFEPRRTTVAVLALSSSCRNAVLDLVGKLPTYSRRAAAGAPFDACDGTVPTADGGAPDANDDGGVPDAEQDAGPQGWAVRSGGPFEENWQFVATDAHGNVFTTGTFLESATVADRTLVAKNGSEDLYVAKYDVNGTLVWLKHFEGAGNSRPNAIAHDGQGNIIVSGWYNGEFIVRGTQPIDDTPVDAEGIVISIADAPAGMQPTVSWFNTFKGDYRQVVNSIHAASDGSLWIAGETGTTLSTRGECPVKLGFSAITGLFVARLNGSGGQCEQIATFGGTGICVGGRVALNASGDIFAGCTYASGDVRVEVNGSEFVAPLQPNLLPSNALLLQLDRDLNPVWARALGIGPLCTGGGYGLFSLAITPSGELLTAGMWQSCLNVTRPGGGVQAVATFDGSHLLPKVLKFTPSGENDAVSLGIPSDQSPNGNVELHGMSVDAEGGFLLVGGTESDFFDFGLGSQPRSQATRDAYVARYSPAGELLWVDQFGERDANWAHSSAIDVEGRVVAGGHFFGTVQPANTNAIESAGNRDAFLIRYPR